MHLHARARARGVANHDVDALKVRVLLRLGLQKVIIDRYDIPGAIFMHTLFEDAKALFILFKGEHLSHQLAELQGFIPRG